MVPRPARSSCSPDVLTGGGGPTSRSRGRRRVWGARRPIAGSESLAASRPEGMARNHRYRRQSPEGIVQRGAPARRRRARPGGHRGRDRVDRGHSALRRRSRERTGYSRLRHGAEGPDRRSRRSPARHARVQQLDARRAQERDRLAVAAAQGHPQGLRRQARRDHRRDAGHGWHAAVAVRVAAGAAHARHAGVVRQAALRRAERARCSTPKASSSTSGFASFSRS